MRRVAHGAPATRLGLPPFDGAHDRHVEIAVADDLRLGGRRPARRASRPRAPSTASPPRANGSSKSRARGGRIAFATDAAGVAPAALPSARRRAPARPAPTCSPPTRPACVGPVGPTGALDRQGRGAHRRRRASSATTASTPPTSGSSPSPRPDLVVADRTYAGVAVATGLEVVAFADLDAVALAVAAWQGRALRIVPLDDRRPPRAYAGLLDLLESLAAAAERPLRPAHGSGVDRLVARSFATRAAGAYAHPAEKRGRRKG